MRLGIGECSAKPHSLMPAHRSPICASSSDRLSHPPKENMSTIASPRPSSSIRSPSSTRASFESSARPPSTTRRNRAALRDYYGLKAAKENEAKISEESIGTELAHEDDETLTELDATEFDADAYVHNLLATEGLKGVLRVEADLVSRMLLQTHVSVEPR